MMNDQFVAIQVSLRSLCKLDTAVLTIVSDMIAVWIIAILLSAYLINVRVFIRQMKIVVSHLV